MSPCKSHFSNYEPLKNCFVFMGDNVKREVARIRNVCINICGYELIFKNVRHCHNLISCAVLEDDGLVGKRGWHDEDYEGWHCDFESI